MPLQYLSTRRPNTYRYLQPYLYHILHPYVNVNKMLLTSTSFCLTKRLFNSWKGIREILEVLSQTFFRPIALILSIRYEASKIRQLFLTSLYIERARCGDAEPLLWQEFQRRENQFGPEHSHTIDMQDQFMSLYGAWHKLQKAEKWRAKLQQTEAKEEW